VYLSFSLSTHRIHIFGRVFGGVTNGTSGQCNAGRCALSDPQMYDLDYWVTVFGGVPDGRLVGYYRDTDGGWLRARSGPNAGAFTPLKGSLMDPTKPAFYVNLGQYRNYWNAYSGYGWLQLPLASEPDLMPPNFRDWDFIVGDCAPEPDPCLSKSCRDGQQCVVLDTAVCVNAANPLSASSLLRLQELRLTDFPEWSVARGELANAVEVDVAKALDAERWRVGSGSMTAGSVIVEVILSDTVASMPAGAVVTRPIGAGSGALSVPALVTKLSDQVRNTSSPLYAGSVTFLVDPDFNREPCERPAPRAPPPPPAARMSAVLCANGVLRSQRHQPEGSSRPQAPSQWSPSCPSAC
jgi:hypothetical protein